MPIDPDEAAGLYAFALRVEAYAGASYPERPTAVELDGALVEVEEVVSQWREQERAGFRVKLRNGVFVLLYYVPELDLWTGVITPPTDVSSILWRRQQKPDR